jgi:hypothetical protein
LFQNFHRVVSIWIDPAQAVDMAQRLTEQGLPIELKHFTGALKVLYTSTLFRSFSEGKIKLFDDEDLLTELALGQGRVEELRLCPRTCQGRRIAR